MKDNKTKVITIAALVVAIIALSIGFAAFSSTLNINTSANVTPTNTFSVKFASSVTGSNGEFTEFSVTPTVAVTSTASTGAQAGTPEIDNSDVRNPSIGNLSAAFTQPGQSVTYTFYVVNDGNYDAYLTNLVFNNAQEASAFKDCVSDSLSSNPATQSLVDNVCSNISFTMSVGSDSNISSSTRLTNHLLQKDHYETVIVTIAYTGEVYADGAFKVNFGDINLNYRTIDEPEVVATQDTPVTSDIVIDALIPTEIEIGQSDMIDEGFYSFIGEFGESSISLLFFESTVNIETENGLYVWHSDSNSASIVSLEQGITILPCKWYKDDDGYQLYTGPSPISLNDFDSSEIKSESYVTRVINSFNN